MSVWYKNPAWFALIFSIGSFAVSILAFRSTRRSARITIQQRITQQISEINDAFVKYEVKGPYAVQLGVPDEKVKTFAAKSTLLFHQLNLLRMVFNKRDVLGKRAIASYESWAEGILRKWIENDDDLRKIWSLFRNTRDLDDSDFHEWLGGLIPNEFEQSFAASAPER